MNITSRHRIGFYPLLIVLCLHWLPLKADNIPDLSLREGLSLNGEWKLIIDPYETGWYDGLPEKCSRVRWEIPYDKPVFVSGFGAGAAQGRHGFKTERWTEEYQEDLYRQTLAMLEEIDGLCGFSPWILIDFRSPRRVLPGIQDGFNRKGLISNEGVKAAEQLGRTGQLPPASVQPRGLM